MNQTWLPSRRGSDRIEHHAPLGVGAADERQQHADAEIEAVEDREADEQDPDDGPPDHLERRVIEDVDHACFASCR